jgi:hypothetical protein
MENQRGGAKTATVLVALVGALMATACGDDVTGPDGSAGMVEAYVEDRSPEAAAAFTTAPGEEASSPAFSPGYSGSLNGRAQVSISTDGETWIELGPPRSVSVALQASGEGAEVHGAVEVPAGVYTYVRLVLDDAWANVAAGSTFGPITLDAAIDVTLGSGAEVTVEKSVPPFEVRADTHTRVTWSLNSHLWLDQEAAEEEEVAEEEVAEAAEPRTETEEPY